MLLELGYPGGPAIERTAREGDSGASRPAPAAGMGRPGCDFSFSGLKTALLHAVQALRGAIGRRSCRPRGVVSNRGHRRARRPHRECHRDAAGRFERGAHGAGRGRGRRGQRRDPPPHRGAGEKSAASPSIFRRPRLCTDNAAMIAWAGIERLTSGAWSIRSMHRRARAGRSTRTPASPRGAGVSGTAGTPRLSRAAPCGCAQARYGSPAQRKPTMSRPMSGGFLWR